MTSRHLEERTSAVYFIYLPVKERRILEMSFAGWIVVGLLVICPSFYEASETTGNPQFSSNFNDTGRRNKMYARQPRSFVNLAAMVFEATRHNPVDFVEYGRWCGIGGSGEPVDDIDKCCQRHDVCYDIAKSGACRHENPYTYKYEWSVTKDDQILCDTVDPCGETLCACDKMIADCFMRHQKSYNPEYHENKLPMVNAILELLSRQ